MSLDLLAATILQTFFIGVFLLILIPFRLPVRKLLVQLGGIMLVLCAAAGILASYYGLGFLSQYGYLLIGTPLFISTYIFSTAKGSRFVFVVLTCFIFHRIISSLLMVVRVEFGGFTPLYFFMNIVAYSALLYGAKRMRADFHNIVFYYQKEFGCLSLILIFLLIFVWLFTPISEFNKIDFDALSLALLLYVLIIMLYFYIGITFSNFSKILNSEQNTLSMGHQMQAAQEHIRLIQATQEKTRQYRHDLRHHLMLIGEFLEHGKTEELKSYLAQVREDIETITPVCYCSNEAANLILASFVAQAEKLDIHLEVNAKIPQSLPISNTELCTLLSNALENAITATAHVKEGQAKTIDLSASSSDGKLLLLVENPYSDTVRIENGLPQSKHKGHGFGTKSMESIVEKYGGLSSFEAQDGIFTVRIVV